MSDENKNDTTAAPQAYLDHCPDCIPLPTQFPQTCLSVAIDALQGKVDDAKCAAHCLYTLAGWGLNLWVADHNPPHPDAVKAEAVGVPARHQPRAWAADQLKTLQGEGDRKGAGDVGALPWRIIAAIVLDLLKELLNKV
jgi:hypothetical protein